MSEYIRCRSCNGSKIIMGGGMITKDCDNCNGRGMVKNLDIIELPKDNDQDEIIQEDNLIEIKKRRGRPKRVDQ